MIIKIYIPLLVKYHIKPEIKTIKYYNENKETKILSWTICGKQNKNQKEESNNGEGENLRLFERWIYSRIH